MYATQSRSNQTILAATNISIQGLKIRKLSLDRNDAHESCFEKRKLWANPNAPDLPIKLLENTRQPLQMTQIIINSENACGYAAGIEGSLLHLEPVYDDYSSHWHTEERSTILWLYFPIRREERIQQIWLRRQRTFLKAIYKTLIVRAVIYTSYAP